MRTVLLTALLFVFPPNLKKEYWNELELPIHIAPLWDSIVRKLTDIQSVSDENGELVPTKLPFSQKARKLLYCWQHKNTDLCNSEMDEVLVGVYSKLDIYIIRFSLILQLSRWACGESSKEEIDCTSVEGAISIAEYFRTTAQRVQDITKLFCLFRAVAKKIGFCFTMLCPQSLPPAKALRLL